MSVKEKIIKEIEDLVLTGQFILYHEALMQNELSAEQVKLVEERVGYEEYKKGYINLKFSYQKWYTKTLAVVKQTIPERYDEFIAFYCVDKRKEINHLTYTISDYLIGLSVTKGAYKEEIVKPFNALFSKFEGQISILSSITSRINSILNDIEGVLQSNLFDNELDAAKDLLKKKHVRASGTLVGVVLESHLRKVCDNHNITFRKKNPTICDFNEELKKQDIIDVPTWRLIQRLGDIRNLSAHPKERMPTNDEIEDLIRGTEKLVAELF